MTCAVYLRRLGIRPGYTSESRVKHEEVQPREFTFHYTYAYKAVFKSEEIGELHFRRKRSDYRYKHYDDGYTVDEFTESEFVLGHRISHDYFGSHAEQRHRDRICERVEEHLHEINFARSLAEFFDRNVKHLESRFVVIEMPAVFLARKSEDVAALKIDPTFDGIQKSERHNENHRNNIQRDYYEQHYLERIHASGNSGRFEILAFNHDLNPRSVRIFQADAL